MKTPVYMPRRLSVVLVALMLALAIAACGDSDDGDDGRIASSPSTSTSADEQPPSDDKASTDSGNGDGGNSDGGDGGTGDTTGDGSDEPPNDDTEGDRGDSGTDEADEVSAVVTGMYEDFAAADAAGVCAVLIESVRRQVAQDAAVQASERGTCTASLANFLEAAKRAGALKEAARTKVGDVDVNGDTATAVVTLAGRSGKVRLVKEDGEWRFGAVPGAGQTGS